MELVPDVNQTEFIRETFEPISQLELGDRMTTVLHCHHEHIGEQPVSVNLTEQLILSTVEQAYQRRFESKNSCQAVDTGWFNGVGVGRIIIENTEGQGMTTIPTDEVKKDIESRIVELSFGEEGDCWLVRPGGFFIGDPSSVKRLKHRCQNGTAKCRITVMPK